jgi:hypothetical protein
MTQPASAISVYHSRPVTRQAVQFTGGNLAEIRKLLPEPAASDRAADAAHIIIREPGMPDRVLGPGMWLSVAGGQVTTHSDRAFRDLFEETEGG